MNEQISMSVCSCSSLRFSTSCRRSFSSVENASAFCGGEGERDVSSHLSAAHSGTSAAHLQVQLADDALQDQQQPLGADLIDDVDCRREPARGERVLRRRRRGRGPARRGPHLCEMEKSWSLMLPTVLGKPCPAPPSSWVGREGGREGRSEKHAMASATKSNNFAFGCVSHTIRFPARNECVSHTRGINRVQNCISEDKYGLLDECARARD